MCSRPTWYSETNRFVLPSKLTFFELMSLGGLRLDLRHQEPAFELRVHRPTGRHATPCS
jgi:hypothetical protein